MLCIVTSLSKELKKIRSYILSQEHLLMLHLVRNTQQRHDMPAHTSQNHSLFIFLIRAIIKPKHLTPSITLLFFIETSVWLRLWAII